MERMSEKRGKTEPKLSRFFPFSSCIACGGPFCLNLNRVFFRSNGDYARFPSEKLYHAITGRHATHVHVF